MITLQNLWERAGQSTGQAVTNSVRNSAAAARRRRQSRAKRVAMAATALLGLALPVLSVAGSASAVANAPVAGSAPAPPSGYWLLGGDGGVFAFGASFAGSAAGDPRQCPANIADRTEPGGTCTAMAATPDGGGYWILDGDTRAVFAFGDARSFGEPKPPVGVPRDFAPTGKAIVATPSGHGYWVLEVNPVGLGSVLGFGDAGAFGDPLHEGGAVHAGSAVTMAATPDGHGYWVTDSDGGVFTFGDAKFFGSIGGRRLNQPIVGMAVTPDGGGYYLVAADGGVFSFGDAAFAGSMGGKPLNRPIVGMAVDPVHGGYWMTASDGGIFSFGGAAFRGSLGGKHLARPIFSIAATANGR
jgi:hypothetical protein